MSDRRTITPAEFQAFGRDPVRFFRALIAPKIPAPFQLERIEAAAPSLLALATGRHATISRHLWDGTKGSDKTSALAITVLWAMIFCPGGLLIEIGARDSNQAGELRLALLSIVRANPWIAEILDVQAKCIVHKHNGSRADILTADALGAHGSRPDIVIIDELTHITDEAFVQTLLDNAGKMPNGLVFIGTNAGFLGTWQERLRQVAVESPRWFVHVYAELAPWITAEEDAEARKRNPTARYNRLWRGIWSTGSGDALDPDSIEAACTLDGPVPGYVRRYAPYLGFLDLGLKHDHAALVVLGMDLQTRRIRLASCQSWNPAHYSGRIPLSLVRDECLRTANEFQLNGIVYDPWQAELMAEDLRAAGVRMRSYEFTSKHLSQMATTLLEVFNNRMIDLYRDPLLLRDLSRLVIVERPQGFRLQSTRDADGHADRATALAMGCVWTKNTMDAEIAAMNRGPEPTRVTLGPGGVLQYHY